MWPICLCENTAVLLKGHNTSAVTKKICNPYPCSLHPCNSPYVRNFTLYLTCLLVSVSVQRTRWGDEAHILLIKRKWEEISHGVCSVRDGFEDPVRDVDMSLCIVDFRLDLDVLSAEGSNFSPCVKVKMCVDVWAVWSLEAVLIWALTSFPPPASF